MDGIELEDRRLLRVSEVMRGSGFVKYPQGKLQVKLLTVHLGPLEKLPGKTYQQNSKGLIDKVVKELIARYKAIVAYHTGANAREVETKRTRAQAAQLRKAFPQYSDNVSSGEGTSLTITFHDLGMDEANKILQALETCGVTVGENS